MKAFASSALAGLTLIPLGYSQVAATHEGNAKVDLLVAHAPYQAGKPIRAAVRMIYDAGYHGYWINPGEGGLKTEVKWKLPAGWTASDLSFPAPQREVTGALASYAYHGEVLLPLEFMAPANASGEVKIEGELSWLACNEKGCVPGEAVISVSLHSEATIPGEKRAQDEKLIDLAWAKIPEKDPRWEIGIVDNDGSLHFTLQSKADGVTSPEGAEIFLIDEQVIDPASAVIITSGDQSGKSFSAVAKRSEYAPKEITSLQFIIHSAKLNRPIFLEWKKK